MLVCAVNREGRLWATGERSMSGEPPESATCDAPPRTVTFGWYVPHTIRAVSQLHPRRRARHRLSGTISKPPAAAVDPLAQCPADGVVAARGGGRVRRQRYVVLGLEASGCTLAVTARLGNGGTGSATEFVSGVVREPSTSGFG